MSPDGEYPDRPVMPDGPERRLLVMPEPPKLGPTGELEEPEPEDLPSTAVAPIDRDSLTEYQEQVLVTNADKLIPAMFKSVLGLVKKGDTKMINLVAQMYNYVPRGGGISIINNLQQATVNNDNSQNMVYFESIVRKMEQQDRGANGGD